MEPWELNQIIKKEARKWASDLITKARKKDMIPERISDKDLLGVFSSSFESSLLSKYPVDIRRNFAFLKVEDLFWDDVDIHAFLGIVSPEEIEELKTWAEKSIALWEKSIPMLKGKKPYGNKTEGIISKFIEKIREIFVQKKGDDYEERITALAEAAQPWYDKQKVYTFLRKAGIPLSKKVEEQSRIWADDMIDRLKDTNVISEGSNKRITDLFIRKYKHLLKGETKFGNKVAYLAFARAVEEFSMDRQYVYNWLDIKENVWKEFCKDIGMEKLEDRYTIVKTIGKGNFGIVFEAYDKILERDVALKVLKLQIADREAVGNLKRELRALRKISYKKTKCNLNISCLYDWFCVDDMFIISMELIKGVTLQNYLFNKTGIIKRTPQQEDKIIKGIADGIKTLQDANVVHMDLHLGNIMVDDSGSPKLIDFGMACSRGYECAIIRKELDWKDFSGSRPPEIVDGSIPSNKKAYKAADIWMLGKLVGFSSNGQRNIYEGLEKMMMRKTPKNRPTIEEVMVVIDDLQTYKKELIELSFYIKRTPWDIYKAAKKTSEIHKISFKIAVNVCCMQKDFKV